MMARPTQYSRTKEEDRTFRLAMENMSYLNSCDSVWTLQDFSVACVKAQHMSASAIGLKMCACGGSEVVSRRELC